VVGVLLGTSILLSATDLLTTSMAIKIGLSEGNYALIALSESLGLGLLKTLELTKTLFIVGCCATSLIGIRMRGRAAGSLAIAVLACFVVIELAVSVNNFSLIVG
jgi:hypothetical protein